MAHIVKSRGLNMGEVLKEGAPHPYLPGCTVLKVKDDPWMGRYCVTIQYDTPVFKGIVDWVPSYSGQVARYGAYYLDDSSKEAGQIEDVMGKEAYGQYGELVGPKDALYPDCVIRPMFEQWLYEQIVPGDLLSSHSA